MDSARFGFLYRQGEGAISAREWRAASALPLGIALALTIVWLAIMPREGRDLQREGLIDWSVALVYLYSIMYVFVLFIVAVAEYFLSAKRFTDRGRPPALAGLAPFLLLLAGAAHWYQPRSEGWMPEWGAWPIDALALAAVAWNVIELGFLEGRSR